MAYTSSAIDARELAFTATAAPAKVQAPARPSRGLLGRMAGALGRGERLARDLDLTAELELLLAQDPGLGLDLLRIATGRLLLRLRLQVPGALGTDLHEAVEALAQPTQGKPGVLRIGDPRGIELDCRLGLSLLRPQADEQ